MRSNTFVSIATCIFSLLLVTSCQNGEAPNLVEIGNSLNHSARQNREEVIKRMDDFKGSLHDFEQSDEQFKSENHLKIEKFKAIVTEIEEVNKHADKIYQAIYKQKIALLKDAGNAIAVSPKGLVRSDDKQSSLNLNLKELNKNQSSAHFSSDEIRKATQEFLDFAKKKYGNSPDFSSLLEDITQQMDVSGFETKGSTLSCIVSLLSMESNSSNGIKLLSQNILNNISTGAFAVEKIMAQAYGPDKIKLNESFQVNALMVPMQNVVVRNCNVPMTLKDGVATYSGKATKAGKIVVSGEMGIRKTSGEMKWENFEKVIQVLP